MNGTYFLGANSKRGFYSLYDGFCRAPGDYLTVIKGTPGSGKSGFMRKIGAAAEARGLDVEYVLCSGDPDSLDGVYISSLRRGWVDGTAPHVMEPRRVGLDGDYINLAMFCDLPFEGQIRGYVDCLYDSYKAEYSAAYGYLAAAAKIEKTYSGTGFDEAAQKELKQKLRGIIKRNMTEGGAGSGGADERFMHALSCKGELYLSAELEKLCGLVYRFEGGDGNGAAALDTAYEEATEVGADCIVCRNPLDPAKIDALLLPTLSLGFVCGGYEIAGARKVNLDTLLDGAVLKTRRAQIEDGQSMRGELISLALSRLNTAKALHDELEEYYKTRMDFAALTEYTEDYIERLFD